MIPRSLIQHKVRVLKLSLIPANSNNRSRLSMGPGSEFGLARKCILQLPICVRIQ
jgi:hypothetical protein